MNFPADTEPAFIPGKKWRSRVLDRRPRLRLADLENAPRLVAKQLQFGQ